MYFDLCSHKNGCFDSNQCLTKCSLVCKIGFRTAMGLGDTRQNVMAIMRDVQLINPILAR